MEMLADLDEHEAAMGALESLNLVFGRIHHPSEFLRASLGTHPEGPKPPFIEYLQIFFPYRSQLS